MSHRETELKELLANPIPNKDLAILTKKLSSINRSGKKLKTEQNIFKNNLLEDLHQSNSIEDIKMLYKQLLELENLNKKLNEQKKSILTMVKPSPGSDPEITDNMKNFLERNLNQLLDLVLKKEHYQGLNNQTKECWNTLLERNVSLESMIKAKTEVISSKGLSILNAFRKAIDDNRSNIEEMKKYIEELGSLDQKENIRQLNELYENGKDELLGGLQKNEQLHMENSHLAEEIKRTTMEIEDSMEKLDNPDCQITIKGKFIRSVGKEV